ncbi:hypothetical protein Bca52824_021102 [Brassica carinata]|uniref:Uncharacterized protein n=1 Tax=Brassica carinata TaxID=52824 RepID=A0A8X8B092_BRACI|nr:hypothetical protein Bca52824_021102 [Brassica carinata]
MILGKTRGLVRVQRVRPSFSLGFRYRGAVSDSGSRRRRWRSPPASPLLYLYHASRSFLLFLCTGSVNFAGGIVFHRFCSLHRGFPKFPLKSHFFNHYFEAAPGCCPSPAFTPPSTASSSHLIRSRSLDDIWMWDSTFVPSFRLGASMYARYKLFSLQIHHFHPVKTLS